MSEIGAVGESVSGALLGRAVEPDSGPVAADGHTHERDCLNCSTPLIGDFCHACGQRGHVHRTISAFLHDLLHGVLHFEGKIWRTLPLLAWRPGKLTRDYIDGKRASFVSPIALFLFSVFIMFAAVSASGNLDPDIGKPENLAAEEADLSRRVTKLETERREALAARLPVAKIDNRLTDARDDLQMIRTMRERGVTEAMLTRSGVIQTDLPWLEEAYLRAKQNPQLLIFKLKTIAYKWSWALIPLSVPFLWLLFPFSRRFRLYDHVVFVTYSIAFMSLLVVLGTALALGGMPGIGGLLFFIPPLHMYRQLRGAYALSRLSAAWRTLALLIITGLTLSLFVMGMLTLGVLD